MTHKKIVKNYMSDKITGGIYFCLHTGSLTENTAPKERNEHGHRFRLFCPVVFFGIA